MRNNIEMMQNVITEEYHWRRQNNHLHNVKEIALVLFGFILLWIASIILS